MERVSVDVTQDALLIFINDSQSMKAEEAEERLEQLFRGAKEYLYLDGDTVASGAAIANRIANERNTYRISVPESNRLVVCFWLDADQLNAQWFTRYQEIAGEIRRLLPVHGSAQHCFITCLTYEMGSMWASEEVRATIRRFADSSLLFSHLQYLLYKPMLENLDRQKAAMLQLLHLWTRKGGARLVDPSDVLYVKMLRIVNSADYQEKEAERCQRRIEELEDWLGTEADPDLANLLRTAASEAVRLVEKLGTAQEHFEELSCRYPVRVTDYHKPLFGKAERIIDSGSSSMLEKRREEYLRETEEELLAASDFAAVQQIITEELHSPDLAVLQDAMNSKRLQQRLLDGIRPQGRALKAVEVCFLQKWYERLDAKMRAVLPDGPKERSRRQMEINRLKDRLKEAGRYRDLQDCLARICGDLSFATPSTVLPKGNSRFLFIAGECNSSWFLNDYTAGGVDRVYGYPDISPAEVMLLKEAPLIDLTVGQADEELRQILQ